MYIYTHSYCCKGYVFINVCKFAWTDKITSLGQILMFIKSFSGIKCWSHKSSIAYVFFHSHMKYELAKEQINYLWLMPVQ